MYWTFFLNFFLLSNLLKKNKRNQCFGLFFIVLVLGSWFKEPKPFNITVIKLDLTFPATHLDMTARSEVTCWCWTHIHVFSLFASKVICFFSIFQPFIWLWLPEAKQSADAGHTYMCFCCWKCGATSQPPD